MHVHASAREHGVAGEDTFHASNYAPCHRNPDRWLVVGPDRAGNLPEVVVVTTVEQTELASHAMPMRAEFRRLLGS